jgi:ATP-dependent DNA ligase
VSKRATSLYRGGFSHKWLKTKKSEFVLLGTEIDDSGISWALLAWEQDGELEFAGPAIWRPPSHARADWADKLAKMAIERPVLNGLKRANKAQWLKPEIRVRARHLKAKGTLRHATFIGVHRSLTFAEALMPLARISKSTASHRLVGKNDASRPCGSAGRSASVNARTRHRKGNWV